MCTVSLSLRTPNWFFYFEIIDALVMIDFRDNTRTVKKYYKERKILNKTFFNVFAMLYLQPDNIVIVC